MNKMKKTLNKQSIGLFIFYCLLSIGFINASEKIKIKITNGQIAEVKSIVISPDNRVIASLNNSTVFLWEKETGKQIGRIKGLSYTKSAAFSPDSKHLIIGNSDSLILWDIENERKIRTYENFGGGAQTVAFSQDGKYIYAENAILETKTGKLTKTLKIQTSTESSISFSPDKKFITFVGYGRDTAILWDIETDTKIGELKGHKGNIYDLAISSNSKIIASASGDGTVRLWDKETRKQLKMFKGHTGKVWTVAFSPDSRYIASGSYDKSIRIWDIATGKQLRIFEGHTGSVMSVAISSDGKYIVSCCWDNRIKIWSFNNGNLLATIISFTNNDWVVYTPSNYYISSPNGDDNISFIVNHKPYGYEEYFEKFKKEEMVSKIIIQENPLLSSADSPTKKNDRKIANKSPAIIPAPQVLIKHLSIGDKVMRPVDQTVHSSAITVTATIIGVTFGINKITILRNDKIIFQKKGSNKRLIELNESISLVETENRIKVIAYNTKGITGYSEEVNLTYKRELYKGKPLKELIQELFKKSRSWAVVIGIDEYSPVKNGFGRLPYAVNDAKAVKNFLINTLRFKEKNVFTLYNEEATKKGIDTLLGETLPNKVKENDRVVVYFSGHGAQQKGSKGKLFGFLIPYDGKRKELYPTCISMKQLEYFSDRIPAKQMIFILDSCFSGIAGAEYKKGLPVETKKQIELFVNSNGRQIMTAGSSNETTVMGDKWNNLSVYTHYLILGLGGAADFDKNTIISALELQLYLISNVPKEAPQNPQLFNLNNCEGQFIFYREGDY